MYTTTFNGFLLDEVVPGFQTLNIEGRDTIAPSLSQVQVSGGIGSTVISSQLPSGLINIHYLLKGNNNKEFRSRLRTLNELLQSDIDVQVQFGDDVDWFYEGRLAGHSQPPYDSHRGAGSFEILLPKPYRYQVEQIGTAGQTLTGIRLNEIELTVTLTTDMLNIRDSLSNNKIVLYDSFEIGDVIKIDLTTNRITKNSVSFTDIDYTQSTLSAFRYKEDNMNLTVVDGDLIIKYNRMELI